ncbi:sirohydrochlorin cobaltochelatase [Bacteroides fluxus]|uniref:Putative sirohydrochlorin cobaltochelatase n=1 Tax=Bacteroides fluxus YIT 12057 TaxID=763034 RepID=F3PUD6_9BACE|nr:sirohydrochlorin cobaltochelatase [Bacteroides fluxus]EGF56233.1 putative sirohydrochlorin cobaltochelatase [Bacteroides fluxus YIT 12057]
MRTTSLFILLTLSLLCHAHGGGNYEHSDMLASMKPGDKAALLMVHFGTTHDDTRTLTIDAINTKTQAAFPELKFQEAYTSRIIIRRLKERGITKLTPLDAMLKLRSEGYTHLIVQSTNIIDGVEMESLRRDVESVLPFFKDIRVGTPLLYSVEDAEKVVSILGSRYNAPAQSKKVAKEHFVLVGHGTYTPSTAIYSQMDYMLKANGLPNFHVGTIEGYPTFETMLAQLKATKAKQVTLVPFMFVAGEHAKNDIAGEWKEALEKEGYTVNTHLEGLGQVPEIQEIFISHIRFGLKHRILDIMTKKAAYAAGKDVE